MAKCYKQIKGELVECINDEWFKNNKYYRYGNSIKTPFYSENIPTCRLCGSELKIMKKGKSALILACLNENCDTNKFVHGDYKLKAFLPKEEYNEILKKRKENRHSYYDKNYLINIKGMSEKDADDYIEKNKKNISEKNKGKTNDFYREKYGEEFVNEKTKRNKIKNIRCIEYWLNNGYSEEEGKKKISEIQKKSSSKSKPPKLPTKKELTDKFGKEYADKFFKEKSKWSIEYWLKRGYDEKYAKEEIKKLQSNNSKKRKKYVTTKTIDYWLEKGYTEEEAKKNISESQKTFSLEKCITKFGKEEGLKKWEERQKKWQKTLHESHNMHVGYSKISQELFEIIEKFYEEDERDYIFYGSKNREFTIRQNEKTYVYDFTDLKNRKIIEFNGDIYHANPNIFNEKDRPNPFKKEKTSKEIWDFDKNKKNVAEDNGFEELIIWENDYKNNKQQVIEQCKQFLLCRNQNK